MSDDKKIYQPFNGFDGPEHKLKLKPTSKKYVSEVCGVQAKRPALSDSHRCQYADQAGYPAVEHKEMSDGTRRPVFELADVYSEYHIHAAMAQAMFFDCPALIEVNEKDDEYTIKIVDEELFDALDEGVVNEAFLSFMAARNGTRSGRLLSSPNAGNART